MLPLFILSHRMYRMATLVLYVHDALMALGFQNSLFVIIQKKIHLYFQMVMLVPRAKVTTSNSIIYDLSIVWDYYGVIVAI